MSISDDEYILKWAKKVKAVNLLGGKCSKCGNLDVLVLSFHHPDNNKECQVGNILSYRWSIIEKEVLKCELLCHNCHHELHFNENSLEKRHYELKIDLLKYKNAYECQECGYHGKNYCSLDFHHIDPKSKLFSVRDLGCSGKGNLGKIFIEIDKCSVICKNCHWKHKVHVSRFESLKDKIMLSSNNIKEKQAKINRDMVVDM